MKGVIETRAKVIVDDELAFDAGPEKFKGSQELMAKIGIIAARYCEIEESLAFFCAYLLGQKGPPEPYGQPVDPLAIVIVNDMRSRDPQQKFLKALIESRIQVQNWPPVKAMWKAIECAARDRNFLMHTPFQVCADFPNALLACPLVGNPRLIDAALLDDVLRGIGSACAAVSHAHNEARKKLNL